jgi:hypothetical protein
MRPGGAGGPAGGANGTAATDVTVRSVEQGALLVAVPPGGVQAVLQMPRGNLEAVRPRALVLPAVAAALDAADFAGEPPLFSSMRQSTSILPLLPSYLLAHPCADRCSTCSPRTLPSCYISPLQALHSSLPRTLCRFPCAPPSPSPFLRMVHICSPTPHLLTYTAHHTHKRTSPPLAPPPSFPAPTIKHKRAAPPPPGRCLAAGDRQPPGPQRTGGPRLAPLPGPGARLRAAGGQQGAVGCGALNVVFMEEGVGGGGAGPCDNSAIQLQRSLRATYVCQFSASGLGCRPACPPPRRPDDSPSAVQPMAVV